MSRGGDSTALRREAKAFRATYTPVKTGWNVSTAVGNKILRANGRSLDSARRKIVSLLSEVTQRPAQFIAVVDVIHLPPGVRAAVRQSQAARQLAAQAAADLQSATEAAVASLIRSDFSLRDSGYVLGISHARVQQICNHYEKAEK